jgi:hypothetical protein
LYAFAGAVAKSSPKLSTTQIATAVRANAATAETQIAATATATAKRLATKTAATGKVSAACWVAADLGFFPASVVLSWAAARFESLCASTSRCCL